MGKLYKGYELMQAITEGEIKENSRFLILGFNKIVFYIANDFIKDEYGEELNSSWFIGTKFELLDDKQEIDIQDIKELDYKIEELENPSYNESWLMNCIRENKETINKLIAKLKQLDKQIKELKENNSGI